MNESIRILGLESIQDIKQKKRIFGGKGCYNEKHAPYLKNFKEYNIINVFPYMVSRITVNNRTYSPALLNFSLKE